MLFLIFQQSIYINISLIYFAEKERIFKTNFQLSHLNCMHVSESMPLDVKKISLEFQFCNSVFRGNGF